jgi:methyl-accepting chemotaxis protein
MQRQGEAKATGRGGASRLYIDLEVNGKAPILRVFLIILLCVLPVIGVSDFLTGDYKSGAGELTFMAVTLGAILLMRKGRYKAASRIAAAVFWVGTLYLALSQSFAEPVAVYRVVAYTGAALGFSSFFLVENAWPMIQASFNTALAVAYIVIGFGGKFPVGDLVNVAIAATIFSGLLGFLFIIPTRMGRGISGELVTAKKAGEERAAALRSAMERSEANLRSTGALSDRVLEIRSASEAALESVSRIETSLADLDAASDAATTEASSIGQRVEDLTRHIETEVSAQEESAASVNQMVSSVATVADSARSRREALRGLQGTAEEGERRLAALIEAVNRMAGSVGAVRDMIAVINKIASSTNLLAMNASIEAAHAGDAGRGFSVVADEIRNLAEGSSRNAKEIGIKLKEVVASINEATEGGGRAGESFEGMKREIERAMDSFAEIAQATEELSAGGKQILESIAALNDASQGLRDSGSSIAKAQGRLLELQARAKQGSGRVLVEAKSVAERAVGLRSSAEAVSEVAERGTRDAAELHESMSRFA